MEAYPRSSDTREFVDNISRELGKALLRRKTPGSELLSLFVKEGFMIIDTTLVTWIYRWYRKHNHLRQSEAELLLERLDAGSGERILDIGYKVWVEIDDREDLAAAHRMLPKLTSLDL